MHGDLSIAPRTTALDLAPGAGRARPAVNGPIAGGSFAPLQDGAELPQLARGDQPLAAARLRALLTDPGMRVSTHHDDDSDRVVLRVESLTTGKVVEQIPSEELLRLYATLRQSLVDERA
jgi:FlaG protein